MRSAFTSDTRLVWSRTVDAAQVGDRVSSQASSASATVRPSLAAGGAHRQLGRDPLRLSLRAVNGPADLSRAARVVVADEDAHLPHARSPLPDRRHDATVAD